MVNSIAFIIAVAVCTSVAIALAVIIIRDEIRNRYVIDGIWRVIHERDDDGHLVPSRKASYDVNLVGRDDVRSFIKRMEG